MSEPIVFLPLSQGKVAIIDFADFEKVGRFKWCAARTPNGRFYALRNLPRKNGKNQKSLKLHCEILGIKGVDHRDGNGLNNCRENLRPATQKQNNQAFQRKAPGVSSKFRGVVWHRRDLKWQASIMKDRVPYYLGYFKVEEDAARAYDKKAKELGFFKEALNFQ